MLCTLFCPFFFENTVCYNFQSYEPILLIIVNKHGRRFYFHVLKFEENWSKIATMRGTQPKLAIMAAMTSSKLNFQNRRKWTSQKYCR